MVGRCDNPFSSRLSPAVTMAALDEAERSPSPVLEEHAQVAPGSPVEAPLRDRKRVLEERFRGLKVESPVQSQFQYIGSPSGGFIPTPRQRARLLEQQRLREFASSLQIPLSMGTKDEELSPKPKMSNPYLRKEEDKDKEILSPSPPGLVATTLQADELDEVIEENHDISSSNNSDLVTAQFEHLESLVLSYASQKEEAKSKELIRRVSVLRVKFDEQKSIRDGQRKTAPKRSKSAFWKSNKSAEKERMLALMGELEAVEHAVVQWSSIPKSSPMKCLRDITVFRISVMSALEHHPMLMESILLQLSELESTIMDYKAKQKRNQWCRSKEALRRIAILKVRLSHPDWDDKSKVSPTPPRRGFSLFFF